MNVTNTNSYPSVEQQLNRSKKKDIITKLPSELITNIIVNLEVPERMQARGICRRFLEIIDDEQGVFIQKNEEYKKLYTSPKQISHVVVNGHKKRFNQWSKSLPITKAELQYNKSIVNRFENGQYYCLTKLFSYDNNYKFNAIEQITINKCFKAIRQALKKRYRGWLIDYMFLQKHRFFYDCHVTHDKNVYFITTPDQFVLLQSKGNNKVEALKGLYASSLSNYSNCLNIHNSSQNVLIIDNFIVHVASNSDQVFILKKINGKYRIFTTFFDEKSKISYLGKKDDNITFLIERESSVYVYEENKTVSYKRKRSKYDYWNITRIDDLEGRGHKIKTSENGLFFAKSNYADKVIHVYRYTQKIATISLTAEEKQQGSVFGKEFSCNLSGTSIACEKIIHERWHSWYYLNVYKIENNKTELLYTTRNHVNISGIYVIKYSPCSNFIEVKYCPRNIEIGNKKNIYSALHNKKCLETQNLVNTFNNTGFLHAEYTEIEDKKNIIIRCCANEEMQIKTIINCTDTIFKIIFSPNSQLVAIMEKNNTDEVVIKVYRIFKLQQNDNIEFAPITSEVPTEVFAEINTEQIIDFKFHPDGFKIIVITAKKIKTFCLMQINKTLENNL